MNRFDRFTTEELKLLKEALYIVINDNDNRFNCNENEHKIANRLLVSILLTISQQKLRRLKHKSMSGAEIKKMNKFVIFTNEELNVIKLALYRTRDDYERGVWSRYKDSTEYEIAKKLCPYIQLILDEV